MSLPSLRNDLAKVYEPKAPAPAQRLAALRAAKAAGLNVYGAMAPTYPECDEADLRATLTAVAELEPLTIFHKPINIRAENVARIEAHAASLGVHLRTVVFATPEKWHLWPDRSLGSKSVLAQMPDPSGYQDWLERWWSRIGEWPATASGEPARSAGATATV